MCRKGRGGDRNELHTTLCPETKMTTLSRTMTGSATERQNEPITFPNYDALAGTGFILEWTVSGIYRAVLSKFKGSRMNFARQSALINRKLKFLAECSTSVAGSMLHAWRADASCVNQRAAIEAIDSFIAKRGGPRNSIAMSRYGASFTLLLTLLIVDFRKSSSSAAVLTSLRSKTVLRPS